MNKHQLREIYKAKRNALSMAEIDLYSKQIFKKTKELDIWQYKMYHIFLSIENKHEIKTNEFISFLHETEKTIVVPKIHSKQNEMTSCRFLPSTEMVKNKWCILEPEFCRVIPTHKIEVVFVPLLISDIKGNRVGYGKGFYDRLLSNCTAETLRIGLNFFEPIEEIIPVDASDIPLNYLITPHEIFSY